MTRRTRRALGLIAPALLTAALVSGGVSAAHADTSSGGSVHGRISSVTENKGTEYVAILYTLKGEETDADLQETKGMYAYSGVPAGSYKLGLTFDSRNLLRSETYGKNDVSFFYSKTGPTVSWSKASIITVTDGSDQSVNLKAVSGERVSGTLSGEWANGPELFITPVKAAPGEAKYNSGSTLMTTGKYKKIKTKSGTGLKFTFKSAALLPGSYVIWSPTLFPGHPDTLYYTGDGKKATSKESKAKVVKITKTSGTIKIGTFKTNY